MKDIATSYAYFKPEIKNYILNIFSTNSTILDVGAGSGTYFNLLGNYYKNIDAVEVFRQNIIDYSLENKYRTVFNIDIRNFQFDWYDLIIFGDVLEHLQLNDAKNVLNYSFNRCKQLIVAVPYLSPTNGIYEEINVYEKHLQGDLTPQNMIERYPNLKCLFNNNFYGYYIKK